ncbi:hypothetical protein C1H46_028260 [Malus baccata]|uniref:Beta-amylase n=1 Tax=Malus baccata TaxID=106549 RepID=A0A540LIA8_MALBA|nr:hypothetical protein C1H46_028260 [Malus baccata]
MFLQFRALQRAMVLCSAMFLNRYPAHPFGDGRWKFPGIGEFQCYGNYMMGDLKLAARKEGKPQWKEKGPQKAGCYNSLPSEAIAHPAELTAGYYNTAFRDGCDPVASLLSRHGAALHVP